MTETFHIAEAVAKLWSNGPELFGARWPEIKEQLLLALKDLDNPACDPGEAADALMVVFDEHPQARDQLESFMESAEPTFKGGYKPLPGNPAVISTDHYKCPDPQCDSRWTRRIVGQKPGKCPQHHLPLVPDTDDS